MGLANVLYEWDYAMCPGNGTSQCALGMNYPRCPGKGTSQSALGKGLAYVPWEWD